jgi:hypothetical protein
MISRSKPEALPLSAAPTDFARLKGFFGTIYKFNMDFEYPITPNQIVNEISTQLGLDRAYIIVRTAESPLEQYQNDYLKYKDDNGDSILMDDSDKSEVNVDDLYGDVYNEELVKMLQSKEAKQYQNDWKEVNSKYYNKGA